MYMLYISYGQITLVDLMKNQDEMQVTYNFKDPVEILFDLMEMGQEFALVRS